MTHHVQLHFSLKQRCCVVCIKAHAGYRPQILNVLQLVKA